MPQRLITIKVWVGEARPCHDSHPLDEADLTEGEVRTLRNRIHVYLRLCRRRRLCPPVTRTTTSTLRALTRPKS